MIRISLLVLMYDQILDLVCASSFLGSANYELFVCCSHFDGVRAAAFHPVEPVLVTASEDHTLKLWNLQKTVPAKKCVESHIYIVLYIYIYTYIWKSNNAIIGFYINLPYSFTQSINKNSLVETPLNYQLSGMKSR